MPFYIASYLCEVLLSAHELLEDSGIRRGGHQNQRQLPVPVVSRALAAVRVQREAADVRLWNSVYL